MPNSVLANSKTVSEPRPAPAGAFYPRYAPDTDDERHDADIGLDPRPAGQKFDAVRIT